LGCGIGEGDCDKDGDCLDGLVCGDSSWPSWADDHCEPGSDTVNGTWGEWSYLNDCSVSCGGGVRDKTRSCDNIADGGFDCNGEYGDAYPELENETATEACNEDPCPIDGGWGDWGDWGTCSVTCGGGDEARTRECNNPPPQHGGADCTADGSTNSETQTCNVNTCPSCSFEEGDAAGSDWTYKKVGETDTNDACGHMVKEQEPTANGATRTQSSGYCYANFQATGFDDDSRYHSCLF